jgi:formylglycine-generating enzyme required for sulfatase activity
MFGEVPLPAAWPVYVSHAEASAYARWRGARLPTEAEWHRAAEGTPALEGRAAAGVHGNFGGLRLDPTASGAFPAGDGVHGVADLAGNGWEWTSTVFGPFQGFEPLPFYPGYSANFFDGRHLVLKGASAATDPAFLRPSFRNWFQPHYQHVFAKFRLVKGSAP